MGSDESKFVIVTITPYNDTAVENGSIGLIHCQSIGNKSDEISDVVKDMPLMLLSLQRLG